MKNEIEAMITDITATTAEAEDYTGDKPLTQCQTLWGSSSMLPKGRSSIPVTLSLIRQPGQLTALT